ncbi:MAG: hypothetical protein H3Z53_12130 [archaeon]|nr:hypothetical protein [archaeon]MCP8315096.1 hypothetical protein [archaeon]MCP8317857.1 hypothetical protein [archaeon]MCP8319393.1 hypothetical protein [archaeon]
MDVLALAVVLGLTAGFCPVTIAFLLPFAPKVTSEKIRRVMVNFIFFTLGVVAIIVPISFILSRFLNLITGGRFLSYFATSFIAIFMGFWALRIIKIPQYRTHLNRVKSFTKYKPNNSFNCGFLFGIITIARLAPLYITMLFLISTSEAIISTVGIIIYTVLMCLPMLIVASAISIAHLNEIILRYSRLLDAITGIILIFIGIYYLLITLEIL